MEDISRRSFLGAAALGGAAIIGSVAGCTPAGGSTSAASSTSGQSSALASSGGSSVDKAGGDSKASGAPDWLGEPPVINEADIVEVFDTEVLVVGAGTSGTFAACFALENGAKVIQINAYGLGNSVRTSAIGAIGSKYQIEAGVEINKEDIINDQASYALNHCDISLMRLWADHSAEMINWYGKFLEDNGFKVALEWSMPQNVRYKAWPTGHGSAMLEGGRADEGKVMEAVNKHFVNQGGTFMINTAMLCLIKENGRVVGIYARNEDEEIIRINASKGVVVATGGYLDNPDMYRALQNGLEKYLAGPRNHGTAKGDGIKACLWIGARMDKWPTTMIFDRGAIKPDYPNGQWLNGGDWIYFYFATQPFLKVAKDGKRITNESAPYDFIAHAAQEKPDGAWYQIWDTTWKEDVTRFYTYGCSTLFLREGSNHHPQGFERIETQMNEMVDNGYIVKADTIEDLARGLLVDVDNLVAEVKNYNKLYEAQYDSQFGKEPFRLSSLDAPPYFGMKIGGVPLCTLDGIVVDTQFRPLDENNNPIEGVYVIGNDSGGFYAHTYPNFAPGFNAGRIATAGMLVGKALAKK